MQTFRNVPGIAVWTNMKSVMRVTLCNAQNIKVHIPVTIGLRDRGVCTLQEKIHEDAPGKTPVRRDMGALKTLPMVLSADDFIRIALKKAKNIGPTQGIKNPTKRERNRGAKQLDALMKELAVPLRSYVRNFPMRSRLHPYEQSLITFTFGEGVYEEVLGAVNSLRKEIVALGKEYAATCAKSRNLRDAKQDLEEGFQKMEELVQNNARIIGNLVDVAKKLRSLPEFNPTLPTLCLVGAPNVGKSSLVRILSSGKPEVCNYPFTTRSILMGHIISDDETFQVTDTPGLLQRADEDRNNLEKLTLAALTHLPTAIMYVHDLSGECGMSVSEQFTIYNTIKGKFQDRLWLDVVSKVDLLTYPRSRGETIEDEYKAFGPKGSLLVSIKTEQGVEELKQRVYNILATQAAQMKEQETE